MKEVSLPDVCDGDGLFIDGDWIESKDQDPLGQVRLIQMMDIAVGKFLDKSRRYVNIDTANRLKCTFLKPGDILISRMPDPIGRACIFPDIGQPAITAVDVCVVRPNIKKVHTEYLLHQINSSRFRSNIEKWINGTTRQRISRGNLARICFPLPPLPEQKRIAAILDKADEIRRKREKAIELTDSFLRSVFLEMFGDPVSNPRKWGTVAIREIAKVVTGNTPSRKISSYYGDEIDWIKSDNINTPSHFLTPASERLSLSGKAVGRVVPRNSILITCIAGSPACIGNAAISTREVAFNQQINALVPFSDNCEFIYSLILLGKKLIQSASTNSMKGMVSKGKLEQIKVINPPDSLQHRFREVFLAHCKHRETLECQLLKIMECQNSLVAHLLYPNNEGLAQRGTASTYETAHAL
jgi:type I restriction enzyme S subunit